MVTVARRYENGACFILHTGLELAALGMTGDPDAAFDRFVLSMAKFNATQLWSQNIRWDLGSPEIPLVMQIVLRVSQISTVHRSHTLSGTTTDAMAAMLNCSLLVPSGRWVAVTYCKTA